MGKKIFYIVLGALVIFGLLFLLWTWFFSGSNNSASQNNGQFGTASNTTQSLGAGGNGGNGEVDLGQAGNGQNTANGTIPLGGTGASGSNGTAGTGTGGTGGTNGLTGPSGSGPGNAFGTGAINVQGVTWLNGTAGAATIGGTGGAGANGNGFTPTDINGLNGGSIGGTVPTIGGDISSDTGNSTLDLLLASGVIGVASCALQSSGQTIGSFIGGGTAAVGVSAAAGVVSVPVNDITTHTLLGAQAANTVGKNVITFQGCITNVLAKAALQQITASVVNWINSGFNGSPSFVTNYEQFFGNVANIAAGQYIQGAGLAFLCTPFKLQIKVAIAQSYANAGAQSCTLTNVINNINSFMTGNFNQGGWAGMLSFTTMPTNNPYGAFVYGQIGLNNAQTAATTNAKNNISPTGFLAVQQISCNGSAPTFNPTVVAGINQQAALAGGAATNPQGCKVSITTPGTVISNSLSSVNDTTLKQLGLANDIDQILNALTQQLVVKTLQNGLSNLSGTTGIQNGTQTPDELAAQTQAQNILAALQGDIALAQQYGTIEQGSISDIENAQSQLNTLANCWNTAASSTSATSAQVSTATANAATAETTLASLDPQIDAFNNNITNVNNEIAEVEQLQSEALSVGTDADVANLTNDYNNAQAAQPFVAQADVDNAQQNRTTLQSQMAFLNNSTGTALQQCQALTQ